MSAAQQPRLENDQVAIAALEIISYAKLERRDKAEMEKLLAVSEGAGFYYLDFKDSSAVNLPKAKERILKLMDSYFNQPRETKLLDSQGKATRGYVTDGTFSAVDPSQPKESFEHLAIGSYDLHQDTSKTLPALYKEQAPDLVPYYIKTCEGIVDTLLSCYSELLGLEGDDDLKNFHRHDRSSDTILAMLSYPGQLTHQKHTDLGSLTILFSNQWGLQAVAPASGQWEWIEPRTDDAIINVGDGLRFLTGKRLFSCLHRVVRGGRAGGVGHRYSLAYLLRPEDDCVFDDADGVRRTAKELCDTKYNIYSAPHAEQDKYTVLTGGMEQTLGVTA